MSKPVVFFWKASPRARAQRVVGGLRSVACAALLRWHRRKKPVAEAPPKRVEGRLCCSNHRDCNLDARALLKELILTSNMKANLRSTVP